MSKEKLIPELRFPDFKKEGEWASTPLNDLCELITKGTTPTTLGFSYTESGVNFIKIESILEGNINLEKAAFISFDCNEALKRSQLKEDDILFSIAGALGVVTTVTKEILPANTNQALSIVRLKNKKQKDYVKAFLKSNHITAEVQKIKAGAAQPNISLNQVANFSILIPKNPQEQQKTATFLSSLDEVIAAHSQKLDLLKEHKKGLMQNLFPQDGEKVPKYRFKEFEKDGEWESSKIGDFIESHRGGAPLSPSDFDDKSDFEVIPKKAINEGGLLNMSVTSPTYCKENFYNNNKKSVVDSSFLITTLRDLVPSGPSIGYIVKFNGIKKYILAQGVYGLKPKNTIVPDFLIQFSNTIRYRKLVNAAMVGSTQVHIRNSEFLNLPIQVPKKQEQQKIASCLSSLDALITAQREKIDQLKLHKKGLMQGLFPKLQD